MSYANQADMVARCSVADLIALTDRVEPPANVIDTVVLQAALDQATGLMDGYLAGQYTVPLATPTDDVKLRCVHLTYYLLHRDTAPEKVRKDYEDALRWLRDVADGRIHLTGAQVPAPESSGNEAQIDAPDQIFTNSTMGGF
ncbi:gp436 family protein [Dongia sp.]|uniref:gp436 family protein n=1 Tax=Dongia sp. TaxID=1977262 RepID=UPI0035AE6199